MQWILRVELFHPPVATLWGNIGCRDDADVGIDEEEREDLAMAWFGRVRQFKGGDTVLKGIREREQTTLPAEDIPNLLHLRSMLFTAEDGLEPVVLILRITEVEGVVRGLLTEGESALRDVLAVIVVQSGGADMLVLILPVSLSRKMGQHARREEKRQYDNVPSGLPHAMSLRRTLVSRE